MGSKSPHVNRQFWGQKRLGPGHASTCPVVNILTATQQHQYSRDANWRVLDVGAHWRHLANMTQPAVRGANDALCQITSDSNELDFHTKSISCHWRTRAMCCIAANVLQTKVDAQCDKLATKLCWQRLRRSTFSSHSKLFVESRQF